VGAGKTAAMELGLAVHGGARSRAAAAREGERREGERE
jgi:hypothetical protein